MHSANLLGKLNFDESCVCNAVLVFARLTRPLAPLARPVNRSEDEQEKGKLGDL